MLGKEWYNSLKDLKARLRLVDKPNDGVGGRRIQEV